MVNSRLFLVGCPRSGTTWLQSLLATHSEIASFPESHFLLVTSRTRRGRWLRKLGLVSPEMRQRLQQFLLEVGRPELMPAVTYRLRPFMDSFVQLLDQLTVAQGKSIWLEKTPGHLYFIDDFTSVLPDARFIHLVRNGADVVASLFEVTNQYPAVWGAPYTIDQCIAIWNRAVVLSQRHCTKPNHLWVAYERLVREPLETLQYICDFIGVTAEANRLDCYQQNAEKLIVAGEYWKRSVTETRERTNSARFQQLFSQSQQAEILTKLIANHETNDSVCY